MRKLFALALLAFGTTLVGPAPSAQAAPNAQTTMFDSIRASSAGIEEVRRGGRRGAFRHRGFRGYGMYGGGRRFGYHRRMRSPGFYGRPYYGGDPYYNRRPGIYFRF